MPTLRFFAANKESNIINHDYQTFEFLYNQYAPKALGFITQHSDNKDEAEEYLINVFQNVWNEIKTVDEHTEKKIIKILLMTCKPIYKNRKSMLL